MIRRSTRKLKLTLLSCVKVAPPYVVVQLLLIHYITPESHGTVETEWSTTWTEGRRRYDRSLVRIDRRRYLLAETSEVGNVPEQIFWPEPCSPQTIVLGGDPLFLVVGGTPFPTENLRMLSKVLKIGMSNGTQSSRKKKVFQVTDKKVLLNKFIKQFH